MTAMALVLGVLGLCWLGLNILQAQIDDLQKEIDEVRRVPDDAPSHWEVYRRT